MKLKNILSLKLKSMFKFKEKKIRVLLKINTKNSCLIPEKIKRLEFY